MNKQRVYNETKLLIGTNFSTYGNEDAIFYSGYITALFDFGLINIKQSRELRFMLKKEM